MLGFSLCLISLGINLNAVLIVFVAVFAYFFFYAAMNGPMFFLYLSEILTPKIMTVGFTICNLTLVIVSFA